MTPREVVKSILNLPDKFLDNIRKDSNPVEKYENFAFPYAQNKDFDFKAPVGPDDKNYSI